MIGFHLISLGTLAVPAIIRKADTDLLAASIVDITLVNITVSLILPVITILNSIACVF